MAPRNSLISNLTLQVCDNPVFIIGSPRSGTTGLAAALQTHPDIWSSDESQILWDLFGNGSLDKNYRRTGPDGSWLLKQNVSRTEFLRFLGVGLNALFTSQSSGKRWIDHTPLYTLLARDLAEMFPTAKFVHIQRDGRRVVHSMMGFARLLGDQAASAPPWARDFTEACQTWAQFVSTGRAFSKAQPDRCVTVTNEALSEEPERGFSELYEFLEMPPHPSPVGFFSSTRVNSSFPTAGPVDTKPWLSWTQAQLEVFNREALPLLIECGYVASSEDSMSRH